MKYLICQKSNNVGTVGNDSSDLTQYFELGWELAGPRLEVIRGIRSGQFNPDGITVITAKDRMFMYSAFCPHVEPVENADLSVLDPGNVVDYVSAYERLPFLDAAKFCKDSSPTSRYRYFDEDYDLITKFDTHNVDHLLDARPHICICLRFRDHTAVRNSPMKYWRIVIDALDKAGFKLFVVGRGTENVHPKVTHLERLRDYTSLIQHPNCKATIGSATGTICLAMFSCKNQLHIVDHSHCSVHSENIAVLGGPCVHFMPIPYVFWIGRPKIKSLIKTLDRFDVSKYSHHVIKC